MAARRVGVVGGGISTLLFVFRVGLGETLTLLGNEVLESLLAQQNFVTLEPEQESILHLWEQHLHPRPCTSLGPCWGGEGNWCLLSVPVRQALCWTLSIS